MAALMLAAFSAPALAWENRAASTPGPVTASARQAQGQRQVQQQDQQQTQRQRASAQTSTVVSVDNTAGGGPSQPWSSRRSNTPDLSVAIAGGAGCPNGATGGVSLPGFGIIAGGNWQDRNCELRQMAALLANMHRPDAAVALLCQNVDVRWAMIHAGTPCAQDRPAPAEILHYTPGVVPAWCREKPLSFTQQYPLICFPTTRRQ